MARKTVKNQEVKVNEVNNVAEEVKVTAKEQAKTDAKATAKVDAKATAKTTDSEKKAGTTAEQPKKKGPRKPVPGYPSWVLRPVQDVNTYKIIKAAQEKGYRAKKVEGFRKAHGELKVVYRADKLWGVELTLNPEFAKTAEGQATTAEFAKWDNSDPQAIKDNLSAISSERRQACSVAKLIAITHQIAFDEKKDVANIRNQELTSKERRQAIYKRAEAEKPADKSKDDKKAEK